ncbi:MAG: UpxY family transcription antiterminator [Candidatus Acidiferrales bacterium]
MKRSGLNGNRKRVVASLRSFEKFFAGPVSYGAELYHEEESERKSVAVNSTTVVEGDLQARWEGAAETAASHWSVVYTCAQHEKSIAQQLAWRAIDSFLPLYEKISRWKDRTVRLQLPLFAGYVFVRVAAADRLRVLQIPGVVRFVGSNGRPAALPDGEIDALRRGLQRLRAEPCPYLPVGRRVRLTSGALRGLEGVLVEKKSQRRFVISLELIQRAIAVELDAADVAPA